MQIKEVSSMTGLSQDTLRYYEKEGLLAPVGKNASGIREYTEEDLRRVNFVKCMRAADVGVEVLKEFIGLYYEGEHTKPRRLEILMEQREQLCMKLTKMQEALQILDKKIGVYTAVFQDKNDSL